MNLQNLQDCIGNTDIYLLDQILKGRYSNHHHILDAGCGAGRNMKWFINNGIIIYGLDKSKENIDALKNRYPKMAEHFTVGNIVKLPYKNERFDHIICNAVLHFAENHQEFESMFSELIRVLKQNGSLFIRMTSDIGLEKKIDVGKGVFRLNDRTQRFLLTKNMLTRLKSAHSLTQEPPLKSVIVADSRVMTTVILQKT